ncbi:MAG: archease [Candidatus Omnitrophica bacterium]|nr:archease [Candidatus Omnitrophota bacterium]
MAEAPYEYFEHTADVGLRVRGSTLEELFANAAHGMYGLLVESPPRALAERRTVTVEAGTVAELFVAWLKELLFHAATDRFIGAQFAFQTCTEQRLQATVAGGRFDPARHRLGKEIKAVTYHALQVEPHAGGWTAQVIFDV